MASATYLHVYTYTIWAKQAPLTLLFVWFHHYNELKSGRDGQIDLKCKYITTKLSYKTIFSRYSPEHLWILFSSIASIILPCGLKLDSGRSIECTEDWASAGLILQLITKVNKQQIIRIQYNSKSRCTAVLRHFCEQCVELVASVCRSLHLCHALPLQLFYI